MRLCVVELTTLGNPGSYGACVGVGISTVWDKPLNIVNIATVCSGINHCVKLQLLQIMCWDGKSTVCH